MNLSELSDASNLSSVPVYRALTDWVVLKILGGVRNGEFLPDQRLSEQDLAQRFDVSRAPVRDALHRLEQIGVVERRLPRGSYVRRWTDADRTEVLALLDALILLSVQLSVGRLTPDDFAKLEQIIEESKQVANSDAQEDRLQIQRDANFHLIIARSSGNGRLVELMEQLMLPLQLYVTEAHDYLQRDFWLRIHAGLLEALRSGDMEKAVACSLTNARESRALLLGHHALQPSDVHIATPNAN
jgi:DNA-binding GntR family transcriptional regulator